MTKSIIFLRFINTNGTFIGGWNKPIPQQTLTLKSFRAEFDTAAHALACKFIKLNCDWLGGNACLSGLCTGDTYNFYNTKGPVFELDDQIVTRGQNMELEVDMSGDCNQNFDYTLYGIDLTGFTELTLQFEFDIPTV